MVDELPLKPVKDADKWNASKLSVGNWYSQVTYYKVKDIEKDTVKVVSSVNSSKEIAIGKDILVSEMNSASAFDKEEKLTRTEMVEKLMDAKETVFTVSFNKKVDDKWIQQVISEQIKSAADLKNTKKVAEVSKQLVAGSEIEMSCQLLNSENGLGRSTVLDLNAEYGKNFRQIDHRTVSQLVLKNVKYTLKK